MLKELYIQNLAVIEQASIPFSQHFNVFTGETGAGKSILIHGINAVLGQRVTKDFVRTGCKKAVISAQFTDLGTPVLECLEALGLSAPDGELLLTREIMADGGSTARINHRIATVSALRELGARLIHIHGQHDNQILRSADQHLQMIDQFGETLPLLQSYQTHFRALQKIAKQLNAAQKAAKERKQKQAYLQTLLEEVRALQIEPGEEDRITEKMQQLQAAEDAAMAVRSAWQLLEENEQSTTASLAEAEQQLQAATFPAADQSEQESWLQRLEAVKVELLDLSESLFQKMEQLSDNEMQYQQLQQRAELFRQVSKTYLCTCDELLERANDAELQLEQMQHDAVAIKTLLEEKNHLLEVVSTEAKQLSQQRAAAARRFTDAVMEQLTFLNMPDVVLQVAHTTGKLTIQGMDSMELLISANKGEAPKPLAKIASGGELSRIMLALKCVIADRDQIPTLIFDEIDTGVSGKAAQKIGFKLKEVGKNRQVLCVTHLSQIAVMANHHLLIEKKVEGERTSTHVTPLDLEGRVQEIARIMAGDSPSKLMLQSAREALQQAQEAE